METITTSKFNKAEEEAFKLGYDASLPNVRALVKEVKRQDAELPEYVKCIRTPDQKIMPGDVLKIREWFCGGCGRIENSDNIVVLNTDCYEPATIDEYKVKHHES